MRERTRSLSGSARQAAIGQHADPPAIENGEVAIHRDSGDTIRVIPVDRLDIRECRFERQRRKAHLCDEKLHEAMLDAHDLPAAVGYFAQAYDPYTACQLVEANDLCRTGSLR